MIGSLVQGKFSDRYGRRAVLLAALWIATSLASQQQFSRTPSGRSADFGSSQDRTRRAFADWCHVCERICAAAARKHIFNVELGLRVGNWRHRRVRG